MSDVCSVCGKYEKNIHQCCECKSKICGKCYISATICYEDADQQCYDMCRFCDTDSPLCLKYQFDRKEIDEYRYEISKLIDIRPTPNNIKELFLSIKRPKFIKDLYYGDSNHNTPVTSDDETK